MKSVSEFVIPFQSGDGGWLMGATYLSIQANTTDRDGVIVFARSFVDKHPQEFQCYLGETLGRWTAVYPFLSPVMDLFAKELSGALECLVLSLVSADEDEVLCNFCQNGKDYSFFKISTGVRRSPKQQAPVAKKLAMLEFVLNAEQQTGLLAYLSDTRGVLWGSDILKTFCNAACIPNAMTSFDYIRRNDYQADLDIPVQLVAIG
jgi:hypothetical protein